MPHWTEIHFAQEQVGSKNCTSSVLREVSVRFSEILI